MDNICANHCCRCHKRSCGLGCEMLNCDCGARLHACKLADHQLLCPREIVPCINAGHGCDRRLPRQQLARHLSVCPASIIECPLMLYPRFLDSSLSLGRPDGDGFCRSNFDSAVCLSLLLRDHAAVAMANNNNNDDSDCKRASSEPVHALLGGDTAADAEKQSADAPTQPLGDEVPQLPSCGLSDRILRCLEAPPNAGASPTRQLVNHHLAFAIGECPRSHDWRPRGVRVCGHLVRRDEFGWHVLQHQHLLTRLADSDTMSAETVCPLAYLGCPARYSGSGRLAFDLIGHAFTKRTDPTSCYGNGNNGCHGNEDGYHGNDKGRLGNRQATLLTLPPELLERILVRLDSHALVCLRAASRQLRQLVDDADWRRMRGCVELGWGLAANQSPTGITGWRRARSPRWFLSGQAEFAAPDIGGVAACAWLAGHLSECQFYRRPEQQLQTAAAGAARVLVIFGHRRHRNEAADRD